MVQRVLVTAGASGIGLAIAQVFAADGARVHIADINEQAVKDITGSNARITGSITDVSDPDAVRRLFDDVHKELGGLDVLVNNAGISGPTSPVEDYDVAAWNAVVNVNLNGTFYVTQRAIPLLKESSQASIIIMSSLAGRFGYPNRVVYSTTKWGLVGFAKTLSLELGPHGITCNLIHPGAVEGARLNNVLEGRAKLSGRSVQEERENALDNQAIKRFVDTRDIAELAKFLAGKHARSISGQIFPIDGDSKATQ
ncbi:SDR family oxidoreductase [Eoetvoesiella caeni]|uniref:NAD(P)-dependent dehydrogenase (Short-subunit alcohol dehydrogenase family) n=1 Tax=Eoetvoesiella caeni TaxID=645616 RepID=A0A366HFL7_9BURK|nr:SDR family oxidoreductase [Eoetvoesiella caeni]MCI2808556.1 SDR family oxidoreductase [Eoetvoesiella caeni]NYT55096.1 SDR family oxidoreductase [Eoetvoesiella caeni]RBP40924.1 NAD(P)-dependent dehydrogenase (short-subunit alcohol dehydrogenase family) [Eoetvoesiella caeni]